MWGFDGVNLVNLTFPLMVATLVIRSGFTTGQLKKSQDGRGVPETSIAEGVFTRCGTLNKSFLAPGK